MDASRGRGIVRETLPYAQYRVEIDGPRQITAHAPSGPGKNFIRVLIGDRVRLELSPRDVTRGQDSQRNYEGTSVGQRICDKCKVIRRRGVVRVICPNQKHKQRQG